MRSSRTLIAFAYVSDQFTKTNDIAQGLIPLFGPLISARAGKPFDPSEFVKDVESTYDLEMHPYVAEELAPAMAQHGYLVEDRRPGDVAHYINREIILPEPPVREEQLRTLIDGFVAFANQHLSKTGISATAGELESALFDRLVRPDFLALILRPDDQSLGPRTLTLASARGAAEAATPRDDEHFDYLVARFILHLHEDRSPQFDLLVAATSGALVAEVVLDLQHPPKPGESLAGVNIAVDSPLILDALDLGQAGATEYAKQLLLLIQKAGATPVFFDATIEEIRRVLRSTLQNYDRKQDLYGPLGRRLRSNAALAAFVRAIIPTLSEEIERLGIRHYAFSAIDRAPRRMYFTETQENSLAQHIGDYPTEEARLHDARLVADILRIRGQAKASGLRNSGIVFVTRNARLARTTRRYLTEAALSARDYFPPCITDRYLAGILWISTGGGGETLSRLRLVANCSAAVTPRRDVVSRLQKFLEQLSPALVTKFEALMTNERAEHFLMDRTLADPTLITQENYEAIYRDIEEVAAERVTRRKDEEIRVLKEGHASELAKLTEQHRDKFREETTRSATLASELTRREASERETVRKAQEAAVKLFESHERWARACLNVGLRAGRRAWLVVVGVLTAVAAITAAVAGDSILSRAITFVLTLGVTFAFSLIGSEYWPSNPLESWIQSRRQKASDAYAEEHSVEDVVAQFELGWSNREVRLRDRPVS
jgi:hypothetical protein